MSKEKLIKMVADFCYEYGRNHTISGQYFVYFSKITEALEVPMEDIVKYQEEIEDALWNNYEGVCECEINDEYKEDFAFDILFYTDYCPRFDEDEEDEDD